MPKPTEEQIVAEAHRLHDERFALRNTKLKDRAEERFNQTKVEVPSAYKKTTHQHSSNIIEDEGRQIATLVHADPVPHLTAPTPEVQPLTTLVENNLTAGFEELERHNGPVSRMCTSAQVHDNIGWIFFAPKKVAYKGQPKAVKDDASIEEQVAYEIENTQFKRDAGWKAVFDYEFANTATVMHDGNVHDPHCVYVWKEIPESTLRKTYGVYKNQNGSFSKPQDAHPGTGYEANTAKTESTVTVIEYWDRNWCMIVAKETQEKWLGMRRVRGGFLLAEWEHNFGRVPYFARPAFVTEQLDEDKKFAGPLDGIYNEMPEHKRLRTMGSAISYQTAFAPLQVKTAEQGETIVDDNGNDVKFLDLEPGKARQMAPGQSIEVIPQSPEVRNFFAEMAASESRIQRYSLPPVAKGESPGADTANAAISNLHRFNLSMLDPMANSAALQWEAMMRFALQQIKKMGETVYVLDRKTDSYLSLSAEQIPSINVTVKATPDQGQQQLLIEKHASELFLAGVGTEQSMYEMMGKENPEEWVEASFVDKLRRQQIMPIVGQQVIAMYGMTDAINAMIAQNAQAGDGGAGAIPGLMEQAQQMQTTGMGTGAPGQPRTPGSRMPVLDTNTQEAQSRGY